MFKRIKLFILANPPIVFLLGIETHGVSIAHGYDLHMNPAQCTSPFKKTATY